MNEDIRQIINSKLDEVDTTMKELPDDNSSMIDSMVENQNKNIEEQKKKKIYLSILKYAKESGKSVNYSEEMSTEELENIVRSIGVQ